MNGSDRGVFLSFVVQKARDFLGFCFVALIKQDANIDALTVEALENFKCFWKCCLLVEKANVIHLCLKLGHYMRSRDFTSLWIDYGFDASNHSESK